MLMASQLYEGGESLTIKGVELVEESLTSETAELGLRNGKGYLPNKQKRRGMNKGIWEPIVLAPQED